MFITIVSLILLIVVLFAVGYFYGSRHFVVHEQTIEFDQLPDAFDGYRICQFSDFHAFSFHCGHEEDVQKVVDLINAQQKHLKASQDAVQAKYEYFIRQRILDFYQ